MFCRDVWDVERDELGVVPEEVVLALRNAVSRSSVDDFWSIWSRNAEAGLFRAYALALSPTEAGNSAFLAEVCYGFVTRRLGVRAVGSRDLVGFFGPVRVMKWMWHCAQYFVHSSLLLLFSFVGVSNLLLMFLRVLGVKGLLSLGGMLS